MVRQHADRRRIPDSWIRTWERRPPPPPKPWYSRLTPPWGEPEVVAPPPPWYQRLLTPWGTAGLEAEALSHAPARLHAAPGLRVPFFRALIVPSALGLFFSLLSLVVGADLGARLRAWLPHRSHVVEPGQTLSEIADVYGVDWRALHAAGSNPRRYPDADRIPAGARLDLPYRAGFGFSLSPLVKFSVSARPSGVQACAALRQVPLLPPDWALRICSVAT